MIEIQYIFFPAYSQNPIGRAWQDVRPWNLLLVFLLAQSYMGLQEVLFVLLTLVCLHSDPLSEGRSDIYTLQMGSQSSEFNLTFVDLEQNY